MEMVATTEVTSIWHRKIHVENSSIFDRFWKSNPRRIDVIISTWIRLSKSMKYRRIFHVEFQRGIDGESTKMCPLAGSSSQVLGQSWKPQFNGFCEKKLPRIQKVTPGIIKKKCRISCGSKILEVFVTKELLISIKIFSKCFPASICWFKVNNGNTRTLYEACSNCTIIAP